MRIHFDSLNHRDYARIYNYLVLEEARVPELGNRRCLGFCKVGSVDIRDGLPHYLDVEIDLHNENPMRLEGFFKQMSEIFKNT
jgi:hypothetical protein